jgi:hypothetical protein
MAAHKQGDHHLLEHFLLSDNHAPDLPHNFRLHLPEPADAAAQSVGL